LKIEHFLLDIHFLSFIYLHTQSEKEPKSSMLCDAHIHYIPSELGTYTSFYKGAWNNKEALYNHLDTSKITNALLVYPTTDAYKKLTDNKRIAELYNHAALSLKKENNRIKSAGIPDLSSKAKMIDSAKELHSSGFAAVSLASSYNGSFLDETYYPLFEICQELEMPIHVHAQTNNPIGFDRLKDPLLMPVLEFTFDISMSLGYLLMNGVLSRFETKFIFSSFGGVMPFLKERLDKIYTMLRGRGMVKDLGTTPGTLLKNVYVDTSGSSLNNCSMAIDLFGEQNVLWGSDYPVIGDMKSDLRKLNNLSKDIQQNVLEENFKKLFNC